MGSLGQEGTLLFSAAPFSGDHLAAGTRFLHDFKSGVNSFRQFLMQTTFKALSLLDETVQQAEVVTALLVIAGRACSMCRI